MNPFILFTIILAALSAFAFAPQIRAAWGNGCKSVCNDLKLATFTGAVISSEPILGKVTTFNASAADSAHLSEALTEYVAGQPADDLEDLLEALFPEVPTARKFQFRLFKDDQFVTESDDSDIRAVGQVFKRIESGTDRQDSSLQNKGLTFRLDHDEVAEGDLAAMRQRAVNNLRKRLIRAEILRGIAAMDAGATNAARTWNAASNPDADMRKDVKLSTEGHGLLPTRQMWGYDSWQTRQDALEDATRANHAMSNRAQWDEAQIARYLGIRADGIHRVDAITQAKKSGSKTRILSNRIFTYHAESGLMVDDPSNVKRFVGNVDAGGRWGVYEEVHAKFTDITVEHYSRIVLPMTAGIRKSTTSA